MHRNTNMAHHLVGTWDKLHESEASQLPLISLALSTICSILFSLCVFVPECHQKRWKSYTAEEVFLFSFPVCLWGKTKQAEARSFWLPKDLFKFRLKDLRKCVSDHSKLQVIGFNDGAVVVHSPDYFTIIFVSCDSVRVDANISNFYFWGRWCLSGRAFL